MLWGKEGGASPLLSPGGLSSYLDSIHPGIFAPAAPPCPGLSGPRVSLQAQHEGQWYNSQGATGSHTSMSIYLFRSSYSF